MAMIVCEGFDDWTSSSEADEHGWLMAGAFENMNSNGRFGTAKTPYIGGSGDWLTRTFAVSGNTWWFSYAFNLQQITGSFNFAQLIDCVGLVTYVNTLDFDVKYGTGLSSTAGSFRMPHPTFNQWVFFTIKGFTNASTGTIDVYINGSSTPIFSATGLNIPSPTEMRIGPGYNGQGGLYDDVVLNDDSGSYCNTYLGDVSVQALKPSADGNSSQFSPGTSNYSYVDEVGVDGDTTTVTSSTAGHIDTYTFEDLRSGTTNVHAVDLLTIAKKSDAGARSLKNITRISSTNYAGTEQVLSASYAPIRNLYNASPATSSAWTVSEVNGAEFGFENV